MNNIFCFLALLIIANTSFSQKTKILTKAETQELKKDLDNVPFPVYRAYEYNDKMGYFDLLFCEKQTTITAKDTITTNITAICYVQDHGGYLEKWRIIDAVDKVNFENSIWFWTKYCTVTDIDGDGIIEPVIVYGTKTEDDIRRIKIITVYKGSKYVIRAVECTLDDCRTFKKDEKFKDLPPAIKLYIDKLLEKMRTEQNVLLKNH